MDTPTDLRFSESHEWVRASGDGTAALGITDFAQSELGDIVYLELPEVGRALTFDDPFGSVESVKAVSDLIAPVSGEILQVNTALVEAPATLNTAPYESWLLVVKLSDAAELDDLLTAEQYEEFTETA
jgi:glycine cleavage system H protein